MTLRPGAAFHTGAGGPFFETPPRGGASKRVLSRSARNETLVTTGAAAMAVMNGPLMGHGWAILLMGQRWARLLIIDGLLLLGPPQLVDEWIIDGPSMGHISVYWRLITDFDVIIGYWLLLFVSWLLALAHGGHAPS